MTFSKSPVVCVTRALAAFSLMAFALGTAKADTVVTAGADGKVKIWSDEGNELATIDAHKGGVNLLVPTPDAKALLTAGADGKVKIWSLPEGKLVKEVDAHTGGVTSLFVTPDGKKVITGGADKKVKIWSASDAKKEAEIDAHEEAVVGVLYLAEMNITITGGADGKVKIWQDGNSLFEINSEHDGGLICMSGNLAEQCIYTGGKDGKLKYWSQGPNGEFDKKHMGALNAIAVLPDGKKVITGGADGAVMIFDAPEHKHLATVADAHKGGVTALTTTPDGKMILTGGADKKVKAWSADGKVLKEVDAHAGAVKFILYLADKKEEEKK
jgi:WD40 repeat protein